MEIYQYAAEFQGWRELDVVFWHNLSLSCDLEKRNMTSGQDNYTPFDCDKNICAKFDENLSTGDGTENNLCLSDDLK